MPTVDNRPYTNRDLATALGLSLSTASRMREAKRLGSMTTLTRLANLTGRPLEDVFNASRDAAAGRGAAWASILEGAVIGHRAASAATAGE
jgi:transcriptional regulator with XRE-family HTH domain